MRKYKNYTDEDFINAVKNSKSIAGTLRLLKLREVGGNYYTVKKHLQRLELDTSHWTGQGWNKGEQLKEWSKYVRVSNAKIHIIKLKGHKCEWCNLSMWRDLPIMLEVDHIDGNRTNNKYNNLRLLCPNCHSQTPTWRNKKR